MVAQGVSDRGSAVLLVAVALVFAGLLSVGAAALGEAMLHRQQAQTAADAAALAGVSGGRSAAARYAARNGAVLVAFWRRGSVVTVVVERHRAHATASASDGP
jgi:Flp pilus assembly protein TadG